MINLILFLDFFSLEFFASIIWNTLHVPYKLEDNLVRFSFWLFLSTSNSKKSFNEVITSPFVQRAIFFNEDDLTLTIIINFEFFNKDSNNKFPIPFFNRITSISKASIFFLISSILYESFSTSSFNFKGNFVLCSFKSKSKIKIFGASCFSLIFLQHTFLVIANPSITLVENSSVLNIFTFI